jgi:hypothetical protein
MQRQPTKRQCLRLRKGSAPRGGGTQTHTHTHTQRERERGGEGEGEGERDRQDRHRERERARRTETHTQRERQREREREREEGGNERGRLTFCIEGTRDAAAAHKTTMPAPAYRCGPGKSFPTCQSTVSELLSSPDHVALPTNHTSNMHSEKTME